MKYFPTVFFTVIIVVLFFDTSGSVINSLELQHNELYGPPVQSCEVEVLAYFIFDPKVVPIEKLKVHVNMMNSMFASCKLTAENICAKLLVTAGKIRLMEAGLHKFVEVVHFEVAEKYSSLHHWYLMYHITEIYLQNFASRHIVFLDTDVLATGKDFRSIFRQGDWDFAFTATPYPSVDSRINDGVVLVHRDGIKKMAQFCSFVMEEILRLLSGGSSGILNQLSVLNVLERSGGTKIEKAPRTVLSKGTYNIKNACITLKNDSITSTNVQILNFAEWNTVPGKVHSYSKFIHFRGSRKRLLPDYYLKLKDLGGDFISNERSNWCIKKKMRKGCKILPYTSKNECRKKKNTDNGGLYSKRGIK